MLQITLSEETARSRAEGSDDDGVDEVDPNEPGTSSGKRSTSKPPAPKKYKPSASASSSTTTGTTLADTFKEYMHRSDAEAKEAKEEVNKHTICTENA